MDDQQQSDPFAISIDEAAKRLGISRSYAYELSRSGELPTVRLGRRILVPLGQLRDLLASGGAA